MITDRSTRKRVILVAVVMTAYAVALNYQLVRVQFGPYVPVFAARSQVMGSRIEKIAPARGLIFDRDGQPLAISSSMYYIEVETRQVTDGSKEAIALVVSKMLDIPFEDLYGQLTKDWVALGQYRIRLTRPTVDQERWPITIDQTVADVLNNFLADSEAPDMSGLSLEPTSRRIYPSGSMAGHVLGFVNQEGKGFFGVEGYYDDWLSGKSITIERATIPIEARLQPDPPAGVNLVLTIDMEMQQAAEMALEKAIKASKAESGEVIVMDPKTGEILAMAVWPLLDPNSYESWLVDDEEEPVITPAVAGTYEPGSTFKILTMAAAFDNGVLAPEDEYIDTGEIEVGGVKINNWDGGAWGPQTMLGCMQHSLNVCLAYVASEKLGTSTFYSYLNSFGIGHLTGIDLAGEVAGNLRTQRHPEWTEADLGTNSFGQGLSVTQIQLITAVSAIANDGIMVQPHIVREVVGPQGVYWPKTTVLGRPIKAETAHKMTEMMAQSVETEGRLSLVDGYRMAGKSGTAQIPTEFGYDQRWTIASFIGWGPVDDPRFVVLVRMDKPQSSPWGSVVAAPVFQEVAERLVVLMGIPPSAVEPDQASEK